MIKEKFLIIKLSSIGDILHALYCACYLKIKNPLCQVDWLVERKYAHILTKIKNIDNVLECDFFEKKNISFFKILRKTPYNAIFDLQGNCKSALMTLFAKSKNKIGFSKKKISEWPNLLVTNKKFTPPCINIRYQYLYLLQRYFNDNNNYLFNIEIKNESLPVNILKVLNNKDIQGKLKMMVCIGAKWENKKINIDQIILLLKKISLKIPLNVFLIWDSENELKEVTKINKNISNGLIMPKISLFHWGLLIKRMNLVLAMDSCSLHLCDIFKTPNFSIFGPTKASIFKPLHNNMYYQGNCPYNIIFKKKCPFLKKCKSADCIKNINIEKIYIKIIKMLEKTYNIKPNS